MRHRYASHEHIGAAARRCPRALQRRRGRCPPPRRAPVKGIAAGAGAVVVALVAFLLLGSGAAKLDPVAQAAMRSQSAGGFRVRMAMSVGSSGLAGPITAAGSGVVDVRDHAASMSLSMNSGNSAPGTLRFEAVIEGRTVYMKLPPQASGALGALGKPWIKIDLSKVTSVPGLSSLGSGSAAYDPGKLLSYLSSVSNGVVSEGREQVDGIDTTHYHADLDGNVILGSLPAATRQLLQLQTIPVDVWIDGSNLVRRIQMTVAAGQIMNVSVTEDVFDYGPQPPPSLPPADQVQDLSGLANAGA